MYLPGYYLNVVLHGFVYLCLMKNHFLSRNKHRLLEFNQTANTRHLVLRTADPATSAPRSSSTIKTTTEPSELQEDDSIPRQHLVVLMLLVIVIVIFIFGMIYIVAAKNRKMRLLRESRQRLAQMVVTAGSSSMFSSDSSNTKEKKMMSNGEIDFKKFTCTGPLVVRDFTGEIKHALEHSHSKSIRGPVEINSSLNEIALIGTEVDRAFGANLVNTPKGLRKPSKAKKLGSLEECVTQPSLRTSLQGRPRKMRNGKSKEAICIAKQGPVKEHRMATKAERVTKGTKKKGVQVVRQQEAGRKKIDGSKEVAGTPPSEKAPVTKVAHAEKIIEKQLDRTADDPSEISRRRPMKLKVLSLHATQDDAEERALTNVSVKDERRPTVSPGMDDYNLSGSNTERFHCYDCLQDDTD